MLRGKIPHFRLTCVAQKRRCLSSLLLLLQIIKKTCLCLAFKDSISCRKWMTCARCREGRSIFHPFSWQIQCSFHECCLVHHLPNLWMKDQSHQPSESCHHGCLSCGIVQSTYMTNQLTQPDAQSCSPPHCELRSSYCSSQHNTFVLEARESLLWLVWNKSCLSEASPEWSILL